MIDRSSLCWLILVVETDRTEALEVKENDFGVRILLICILARPRVVIRGSDITVI